MNEVTISKPKLTKQILNANLNLGKTHILNSDIICCEELHKTCAIQKIHISLTPVVTLYLFYKANLQSMLISSGLSSNLESSASVGLTPSDMNADG